MGPRDGRAGCQVGPGTPLLKGEVELTRQQPPTLSPRCGDPGVAGQTTGCQRAGSRGNQIPAKPAQIPALETFQALGGSNTTLPVNRRERGPRAGWPRPPLQGEAGLLDLSKKAAKDSDPAALPLEPGGGRKTLPRVPRSALLKTSLKDVIRGVRGGTARGLARAVSAGGAWVEGRQVEAESWKPGAIEGSEPPALPPSVGSHSRFLCRCLQRLLGGWPEGPHPVT